MSEKKYLGGYLNGSEIRENLNEIFVEGTVSEPDVQIQQAGIDLKLDKLYLTNGGEIPFYGEGEWCYLPPGTYVAEFMELPRQEVPFGLLVWPRSTLFRIGGTLDCGEGKLPVSYQGPIWGKLHVVNPLGIEIQRGVRLAQAMVCGFEIEFSSPHRLEARSRPLTVSQIFAFRSRGLLGINERTVETKEVEKVTLGMGEGFLMRFAEVASIASDEIAYSLGDNPHREIQKGFGSTRPIPSPYQGLFAMGAVADSGYTGQLSACVFSYLNQVISKGVPLLRLEKHSITPVGGSDLYNGKYQGTGLDQDTDAETVVWQPPYSDD